MKALVRKTGLSFLLVIGCAVLALVLAVISLFTAPSDADNGKFQRANPSDGEVVRPHLSAAT